MDKLYILTRYLTLPGAMARGIFEHLACRLCSLPVEDNRLLRADELCSHVEHELAPTSRKAFSVCYIPFFLSTFFAFLLFMPSVMGLFYFELSGAFDKIVNAVAFYFAFSLFVNCCPSIEDALNMREKVYKKGTLLQKIFYTPGFIFCYIGAFAEKYSVTFILALAGLIGLILI